MAELKIKRCVVGMISTNCYIVYKAPQGEENPCIIIDPGDNASYLAKLCRDEKLKPEAILLTHGHMQHVNYRLDNLYYKAMEENCKAVFFGHTHKALVTEEDGIYLVNPGSLSQPRDNSDGSYAIVRTTPDSFEASIVYYSTIMGSGNKNKPRAGYIRSILNYSDRF